MRLGSLSWLLLLLLSLLCLGCFCSLICVFIGVGAIKLLIFLPGISKVAPIYNYRKSLNKGQALNERGGYERFEKNVRLQEQTTCFETGPVFWHGWPLVKDLRYWIIILADR